MSEETGQNGQDDKVNFDSANIGKKQKATQFTIIEGAEERAKAAERAKIEAEKEAEELHEADIEAASANQAKAEEEQRMATAGLGYKLFGGKRKWIWLGILILIAAGVAIYYFFFRPTASPADTHDTAKALYEEQLALVDQKKMEETYNPARDKMQEAWEAAESDYDKFWYGYYYALMLRNGGLDEQAAYGVLAELKVPDNIRASDECDLAVMEYRFSVYGLDLGVDNERWAECL